MTEHLSKTPYTIRPYAPKGREWLREICLATATPRIYENRALREWILLMYNDYYTALEGAHCFVEVDDQDRPLGYVICAPATGGIGALSSLPAGHCPPIQGSRKALAFPQQEGAFAKEYPAHFHIHLLPPAQRQGLGKALIAALIAHLKAQGVPGLMLGCSTDHSGANAFYRACGFHIRKETADTVYWGMKL